MLLFENDFVPLVEMLKPACREIERFVTLNDKVPIADLTYEELLDKGHPERADIFSFDENSIAELFYTSGSTGTPKGVMLGAPDAVPACARGSQSVSRMSRPWSICTPFRCFTPTGGGARKLPRMLGVKQIMVRRFEPTLVFKLIQEHHATDMSLVPTMANALLNAPDLGNYDFPACAISCWAARHRRPSWWIEWKRPSIAMFMAVMD